MSTDSSGSTQGRRFSQPDDVYQLKVSLLDVEPPIWRKILVAQDVRLPRLHRILQVVMGWTDSHLHQFMVGDVRFGEPDREFEPSPIDYATIQLNQIAPRIGSTCIYEYDFGDGWEHLIEVEDTLPVESVTEPLPQCLDGERAGPPEDVGGPGGYASFLVALTDPHHPDHEEWRARVGDGFDPSAYDPGRVNRLLARFATRRPGPSGPRRPSRRS
jgi:Plasmid pRiA4b ORF-3-like protein